MKKDFPPYNTVFYYFDRWKWEGVFEELMETLSWLENFRRIAMDYEFYSSTGEAMVHALQQILRKSQRLCVYADPGRPAQIRKTGCRSIRFSSDFIL